MGKLTWQQLGLIYEGNFGVDPTEAAAIISEHLFTKNYHLQKLLKECV